MRYCHIVDATVGNEAIAHDGAYDLFDRVGKPKKIARLIRESLKELDIYGGSEMESMIEAGQDVYLRLTIRVSGRNS